MKPQTSRRFVCSSIDYWHCYHCDLLCSTLITVVQDSAGGPSLSAEMVTRTRGKTWGSWHNNLIYPLLWCVIAKIRVLVYTWYLETSGWGCWKIWTERKRGWRIWWDVGGVNIHILSNKGKYCHCYVLSWVLMVWEPDQGRAQDSGTRTQEAEHWVTHRTSNCVFVFPVNIFMTPPPRPRILECVNQNLPTDTRLIIDNFLWGSHVYFESSRPLMCYIFVSAFDG